MPKDLRGTGEFRASIDELEPAWQTRLGSVWHCRTADALDAVTADGYFDPTVSHGFRVNDRIEVTSLATTPASFAVLAVTEIRGADAGQPRVIVRPLAIYEGGEKGQRKVSRTVARGAA